MATELYSFETANLTVRAYAEPEDMDPADSFEFDEDIEAVRSGAVDWFSVSVEVKHSRTGALLGLSTLGGCAYANASDFVTGHRDPDDRNRNKLSDRADNRVICHYFPDMIREACREARENLAAIRSLPVRS